MAATTQEFTAGEVIGRGRSIELPVENGQAYTLNAWSEPASVKIDSMAPTNGFALINKVFAAALIYLSIEGGLDPNPIYISPIAIPGASKFTPITKIAVWFHQNIGTTTMVVVDMRYIHIMDFSTTTSQTTTYTNQGTWNDGAGRVSRVIDYTKVIPAYTGDPTKKSIDEKQPPHVPEKSERSPKSFDIV